MVTNTAGIIFSIFRPLRGKRLSRGQPSKLRSCSYNESTVQLSSRLFEVRGQLRMGQTTITEKSLLLRDNSTVQIVWRDRGAALRFLDGKVP